MERIRKMDKRNDLRRRPKRCPLTAQENSRNTDFMTCTRPRKQIRISRGIKVCFFFSNAHFSFRSCFFLFFSLFFFSFFVFSCLFYFYFSSSLSPFFVLLFSLLHFIRLLLFSSSFSFFFFFSFLYFFLSFNFPYSNVSIL